MSQRSAIVAPGPRLKTSCEQSDVHTVTTDRPISHLTFVSILSPRAFATVIGSTSCFILEQGFQGQRIRRSYLRCGQIQDTVDRCHLEKFQMAVSLHWLTQQ